MPVQCCKSSPITRIKTLFNAQKNYTLYEIRHANASYIKNEPVKNFQLILTNPSSQQWSNFEQPDGTIIAANAKKHKSLFNQPNFNPIA